MQYTKNKRLLGQWAVLGMVVGLVAPVAYPVGAQTVDNDELWYGSVSEVRDSQVTVTYTGPGGDINAICDVSGSCDLGNLPEANTIFAARDGEYALRIQANPFPEQFNGPFLYSLYKGEFNNEQFARLLPVNGQFEQFKLIGDHLFFRQGNAFTVYDIDTKDVHTFTVPVNDLSILSFSPDGESIATYSYVDSGYTVFSTTTGQRLAFVAAEPKGIMWSGNKVVALNYRNGFMNAKVTTLNGEGNESWLDLGNYTVEDFTVADDHVYLLDNSAGAYEWQLRSFDLNGAENEVVSANASYGDFVRTVDDHIIFTELENRRRYVVAYDPVTEKTNRLLPDGIRESTVQLATAESTADSSGVSYVVTEPKGDHNDTLVIWMHGGPQRQTNAGYHSYTSYAVYDELLQRLAAGGTTVAKVDYSGSWGYGQDFIERLQNNIGGPEIDDVVRITNELRDKNDYEQVVLVGNSYGGYMALKALADHPDTFDGAVSINGVTNWLSLVARIPSSPFAKLFGGAPSQTTAVRYIQSLVETGLKKIDDQPVVVIYGEADSTVPTWQSTEFVETARRSGVENVVVKSFPGEAHVLKERETLDEVCKIIVTKFDLDEVSCEL